MSIVLLYHDVAPRSQFDRHGRPGLLAARYKLEPAQFEAHLDALERTNKTVGIVGDGHPPPEVAISFDDGGNSAIAIADALEKRGWRGHFFVITGLLGTPGFLDAEGVRELDRRGHVVGSHTHSHPDHIGQLSNQVIATEWVRSRAVLKEVLGKAPAQAAVPGGDVSPALIEAAERAGYAILMTSDPVLEIKQVGALSVIGRFPIRASTRPVTAAAYATCRRDARARLALSWKAKRAARRISPAAYDALRRLRAGDS